MWTQSQSRVPEVRARLLDLVQHSSVGRPLPGERVLAADWGVARMTLRRAVDDLVADGLLERRQGSGTFVAQPKTARRLALVSFSEAMHRHGLEASTRVLELRHLKAPASLARNLRKRYGIEVFTGTLTVEPVLPDAKGAELLQIPATQPCFHSKVTVRDRRGQVIEISSSLARGDHYRLSTDL